ncbi:MAG TPA: polysaccharide biosynthesis tyrosine autokinase [bacterium]|nr:polysaccharide biosynthesis tyrosine autokinase [bacterium]
MQEYFDEQVEQEVQVDFKRYLMGVLKRWWLVGGISAVIAIPWIMHVKRQPPIYEADVWVSFENAGGGVVPSGLLESRRRKLKSRTFATEVTARLGLTLHNLKIEGLPNYDRTQVFKHFSTKKEPGAIVGDYVIRLYPSGFAAIYHGDVRLDSLYSTDLVRDTLSYNGLYFSLRQETVDHALKISFQIRDFQSTVNSLISRENVFFDQTATLMRVTLRDNNPNLASETVNMLAEIFVQEILEMQRKNESYNRKLIEERLELAQQDLDRSDRELKSFRNSYLRGLDQETQNIVRRMDEVERQSRVMKIQKEELELLLSKINPEMSDFTDGVSVRYIYREIASLGLFSQSSEMTVVRQGLRDLDARRGELLRRGLPEHNPEIKEISDHISGIEMKIVRLAEQTVTQLGREISALESENETLQKRLRMLPGEEMRLVQLSRQRRANEEIHELLLKRHKEAELAEAVAPSNVLIIDPAVPPAYPISKDKKKMALYGLFAGFGLGIGAAFLLEVMDKNIRTREDVSRFLKLPILGGIPRVKFDDYELQDSEKAKSISSQIVTHDYSPTPVGEAYRVLRTNLLFSKEMDSMKSLVIGSMTPGEGKSFTSANLAITLAQQKSNTLLIDADLRRGVLHNTFNCLKKPGLTNYLTGVAPLGSVLRETYIPNLSLITCGSMIPNPSEILGSLRMQKFIEGISKRFDFIIFDTPPLYAATDAVVLGTLVDGVAIVVRAGKTNGEEVRRRLELFQNVQAKIVGVILNGSGIEVAHEGYSYYRY